MGAAAAKVQALEDTAVAPETPAEARLAVAAHALLQWDCSPGAGIRDAEAACTNRSLLSAVDEILHLNEIHAFSMASPARRRMDSALDVAMSRLMDEFLLLRVWDASRLQGTDGLLFAVEKLSVSLASGGVWPAFPTATGGSASSGAFSVSASDELYASDRSLSSWPDVVTVVVDGAFSDEFDLICPASLPVLHEIALRVIRDGYTKELLQVFAKASCHVLDRFLSILQLDRPFLESDRVNFEHAEWWTTEDMVKRWILATKLVGKALAVMQRQLRAKRCGAFDRFKDDYFMAIAKQSIVVLLKVADGFSSTQSPEKLIYVLELYEALSNSAPPGPVHGTGQHAELISRQLPVVLAKLARCRRPHRQHPSRLFFAGSGRDGHAGGRRLSAGAVRHDLRRAVGAAPRHAGPGPRERRRRRTRRSCRRPRPRPRARGLVWRPSLGADRGHGTQPRGEIRARVRGRLAHLFLANNTSFVLSRAADADVASLLGDDWAARRRSRLQQHTASYLQASWGPVVACLETAVAGSGKPAKALAKFNAAFEKRHASEVPIYGAFLQKHLKRGKSVRYTTANDVAQSVSGMFEGER